MISKNSTNRIYPWKRFWVENGRTIYLDRDGYLSDPEDNDSFSGSQKIHRSYEEIKHYPVLFLLGEPGIGKSTTIHQIYEQSKKEGESVLCFDLESYTGNDLDNEIFNNEQINDLKVSGSDLTLFFDSFDECILHFKQLATKLSRKLKELPAAHLRVRIACRTAELPEVLKDEMAKHWGEDNVGVFELAPLRRQDVVMAAKAHNINSDKFLDAIQLREAVSFAIRPITLKFLLDEYQKNQQLPNDKHSLYKKGCEKLCEEFSDSRRAAGTVGEYTVNQRVRAAERIAAIMMLSNHNSVWTGRDSECPEDNLKYSDFVGYSETVDSRNIEITESIIEETLQTALFSGFGEQRLGWAHWSYAEFLAAEYLNHTLSDDEKLLKLICYPGSSEPIVGLYEVIAWLAVQRPAICDLLIKEKPEVLLLADLQMFLEEWRETLTEKLLERLEKFDIQYDTIPENLYAKLKHPKLAEQLKSYICSEGTFGLARHVAMKIAEVCNEQTLLPVLIKVLRDTTDNYYRRIKAARVISRIGTDEDKDELRNFLQDRKDDPNQEIKAIALNTLWSKIDISTLLNSCTPLSNHSLIGEYLSFCKDKLPRILQEQRYLLPALEWLNKHSDAELQDRFGDENSESHVSGSILLSGWQHLETPEIQDIYAGLIYRLLKIRYLPYDHHELMNLIAQDQIKRHFLLEKLFVKYIDNITSFDLYRYQLFFKEDLVWLQQYSEHSNSAAKQLFTDLTEHFQRGEEFRQQEETRQLSKNIQASLDKQKLSELVIKQLDFIESGNPDGWIKLCWALASSKTKNNSLSTSELANVHNFYGWKNADEPTRQRIIEAAKSYVAKPINNTVEMYEPSISYSAFNLLLSHEKSYLEQLDKTLWKGCALLFAMQLKQYWHENLEKQQAVELYQLVLAKAQDKFLAAFRQFIEQEEQKDGLNFIGYLPIPTNNEIGTLLLDFIRNSNNIKHPSSIYHIFGKLLTDGYSEAREIVLKCTQNCFNVRKRDKAAAGACVLVKHDLKNSWNIIWQMIQEDEVFGKELMADFVEFSCYSHEQLSEQDIANLYLWIEPRFPPESEESQRSMKKRLYRESSSEKIFNFSKGLLVNLAQRETSAAYQALQSITQALPSSIESKYYLNVARDRMYRNSWQPSSPKNILGYIHNNVIFARTNGELLGIVMESLDRLNARLDTIRHILWNNASSWRPKDENSVSDFVKDHLQMDFAKKVIVDREVQVRSRSGKGRGESIDILVHATSRENNEDILSVVIEAKGCWHDKLKESIEKQLAKQYLTTEYTHGIYLVYWFLCDEWDESHYQKNACKSHFKTRRELEDFFAEEAKKLSVDSKKIKSYVLDCSRRI